MPLPRTVSAATSPSIEELKSILDAAGTMIVATDAEGIIRTFNLAAERLLGWRADEVVGTQTPAIWHVPAELTARAAELSQALRLTIQPGMDCFQASCLKGNGPPSEWTLVRKDGSTIPSQLTVSAVRDAEGRVTGFVYTAQDVFAHVPSEQEDDRFSELNAANQELIQASRFKSEFLATISHELRTPLNGVLGMNDLLLKTPLTDRQREYVEASNTSGHALLSLINDVLDISKIEAGKIELEIRSCDLESLAYDVVTMFSFRAKQTGIALVSQLDPETCVTALCDDTRLRQIMVNLIGNALKFTSKGSVTLESKCVLREDQRIVIRWEVTDTGLGIPEDKVDLLFSPFSQVDRSTSRKFGGTGLGLSITKQLVELMGGTIGITSCLGVGSTFWFEVPFEIVSAEMKTVERRQVLAGTRVFVVNGIERERRQIVDCLAAWGCPYQYVGTLREAVDIVSQAERDGQAFATALVDCRLANGDEFIHLQYLARRPGLAVIGLGIDEDYYLAAQLRKLGLQHLLRVPIHSAALFHALRSGLAPAPLATSPAQPVVVVANEPATIHSGHILVAEDNRINQMFVSELLKHCGCTCDIANNGDEALIALREGSYDLVLMDCQMPEMDGFTATREIRRREALDGASRQIPIIALTANALKGDRERCLDAGMDDYLTKPLQAARLQAMLGKYLETRIVEPTI